jgi:hypothetical protein
MYHQCGQSKWNGSFSISFAPSLLDDVEHLPPKSEVHGWRMVEEALCVGRYPELGPAAMLQQRIKF